MGKTPNAKGRTRSKARKRKAQRRPATRDAAVAAARDRRGPMAKRLRSAREEIVAAMAGSPTPKKSARVRGRSSYRSLKPEAAGRGR
jgi:hypothetical protein